VHELCQSYVAIGRFAPHQPIEILRRKRFFDSSDPVGALGVAGRRPVIGKIGLADKQRGHGWLPSGFGKNEYHFSRANAQQTKNALRALVS
jgi:hypothetical protein